MIDDKFLQTNDEHSDFRLRNGYKPIIEPGLDNCSRLLVCHVTRIVYYMQRYQVLNLNFTN